MEGVLLKTMYTGTSLAVQWLVLSTLTAGARGSIPGQGTKILQATQYIGYDPTYT